MAPREPSAWERASSSSSSYFDPSGLFADFKPPKYPDYSGSFGKDKDESFSNAWKTGFDVAGGGKGISSLYSSLFDKAKSTDKYREWGERSERGGFGGQGMFGGGMLQGTAGQVLENLGVVYPQQHAPMFIPGVEGKKGFGGAIGSIAGGILGSVVPGVGTALGSTIGGGVGSMF